MSVADDVDPFVHNVAIKLSRAQNTINPNDLFAKTVIDIAKTNARGAFIKAPAAATFGRFQQHFLEELHDEIQSHIQQQESGLAAKPVYGINVIESEVLAPEPTRQGGLVRPDSQHTFRQPAKPLQPPTPRTSVLGLDRLAQEKRARAAAQEDGSRKRPRLEYEDGSFKVPNLPMGRNARQRGEETPSHPGGLSEAAAQRLAEHRRNRERQKDAFQAQNEPSSGPRGLGDFQRRSNRDEIRRNNGRDSRRNGWDATLRPDRDAPSDSTPRDSDGRGGWGGARDRRWDAPTPRVSRDGGADEEGFGISAREWEEEQFEDLEPLKQGEIAAKQTKRISARQAQFNADNDLWEANRMMTSGIASRAALDLSMMDDDSESTVHVIVHDLKPPFLDGRTVFTKQLEPINPIRDPTSDMAVFAKKGSALVKEKREQAERAKAAANMASLSGTQLGNIMGVRDEEADADAAEENANAKPGDKEENYKGDSQFASHLKTSTAMSSFAKTRTLKEQREYLPAFACREELLKIIRDNQVVVVVGETGSGKTTQLGQFLHEDGYCTHGGLIGCTQPRRVAAMSVAKRVSEEMELVTPGLHVCRNEDQIVIILDEAHERSLNTDVLMGLLKKILSRRRDLKLIVTSATMNAEKVNLCFILLEGAVTDDLQFSRFYGNAPCFTIPSRTFPVEIFHSKSPCEDYVDSAVKQILQIHLSLPPGDILVFMTGQEDIEITCQVVNGLLSHSFPRKPTDMAHAERLSQLDDPAPLAVLPIYSQMPADLQAKIFEATPDGRWKVIVATNIAETSLTVDGILYVVDAGLGASRSDLFYSLLPDLPITMARMLAPGERVSFIARVHFRREILGGIVRKDRAGALCLTASPARLILLRATRGAWRTEAVLQFAGDTAGVGEGVAGGTILGVEAAQGERLFTVRTASRNHLNQRAANDFAEFPSLSIRGAVASARASGAPGINVRHSLITRGPMAFLNVLWAELHATSSDLGHDVEIYRRLASHALVASALHAYPECPPLLPLFLNSFIPRQLEAIDMQMFGDQQTREVDLLVAILSSAMAMAFHLERSLNTLPSHAAKVAAHQLKTAGPATRLFYLLRTRASPAAGLMRERLSSIPSFSVMYPEFAN
ncbi:hypothetical protein AURDEDRAFT_125294 [Auricularia subglabra TFB-10046 SS5]|nr:hypothetical protein AURDEDRAFT_125294 [Auricularia subglabra TFB-10046 SS5]